MVWYEGLVITSGEKGFGEVGSVDVEVIRVVCRFSSPDGQRKGDGALGG